MIDELERPATPSSSHLAVEGLVQHLVASWQPMTRLVQRRGGHRIPFEKKILLHEVDQGTATDTPIPVAGKDISLEGVSFIHDMPLAQSQVAVSFELPNGMSELIVTRLIWCRFTRQGWYESGGRFLRPLSSTSLINSTFR